MGGKKKTSRRKQDPEFTSGKYDPEGDKKLFVAVNLDITSEKFLAAREQNEKEGRQIDFLFTIDGKRTEITFEEMREFVTSRHVEDIPVT
jgi:hypothetical protein